MLPLIKVAEEVLLPLIVVPEEVLLPHVVPEEVLLPLIKVAEEVLLPHIVVPEEFCCLTLWFRKRPCCLPLWSHIVVTQAAWLAMAGCGWLWLAVAGCGYGRRMFFAILVWLATNGQHTKKEKK